MFRLLCRIIIGIVFIFSGIIKAIDPLGTAYKFHDYFQAFNIGFLDSMALPLAILLFTAEFIAGFAVLTGIRQRTGILGVLILMVIFTPLTLIIALTNPVSDCGCFGDAIHLTNWQTFGKNIILIAMTITLYAGRKKVINIYSTFTEWIITTGVIILFILFSFYNLRYLPVIDFLPYKTGVKIADKMIVPEGMPVDQYETSFIYEKDGVKKEFSLNDYPANDTSWKFIDQKSVLIKKGYQPPVHDFLISTLDGNDLTQKILEDPGYSLLMVSKKLSETADKDLSAGFNIGRSCIDKGINFYVLTSSGTDEIKKYSNGLLFCSMDETTLKTMVRANPGYILLRNGVIEGKWSWANIPDKEWFGELK
ncbi:MAG TPA: DoxX family protein [Bacteroidales bacterium]|nr:DoxX family protein [Bacteroidales bacterium]HPT22090.1 DoxX family protein [Bacteroidales bacterium]